MNNEEAKFILGAYSPDGREADDPVFAAALAQAQRDPELRAWFEAQRKFDAAVAAKLRTIAPPPGLREAILAGARASAARARRRWWQRPIVLAAAAGLALAAIVGVSIRSTVTQPTVADLLALAQRDLADAHTDHEGYPAGLEADQARLARAAMPLTSYLRLDWQELRKKHCRMIRVGGREVFELCFQRDGTWYHVYVGRRNDFAPGRLDPAALMKVRGQFASTAWADADHVYALVTDSGVDALRRVI